MRLKTPYRCRLPETHIKRCGVACPWCGERWLEVHAMQDARDPKRYHCASFGLN
jgi:hypothetical protein